VLREAALGHRIVPFIETTTVLLQPKSLDPLLDGASHGGSDVRDKGIWKCTQAGEQPSERARAWRLRMAKFAASAHTSQLGMLLDPGEARINAVHPSLEGWSPQRSEASTSTLGHPGRLPQQSPN